MHFVIVHVGSSGCILLIDNLILRYLFANTSFHEITALVLLSGSIAVRLEP